MFQTHCILFVAKKSNTPKHKNLLKNPPWNSNSTPKDVGSLGNSREIPNLETTLPETNSQFAPENGWLEYEDVSFWVSARPTFSGALAVSFRVPGNHWPF